MVDMAVHQIYPAAVKYTDDLCQTLHHKQTLKVPCKAETELVNHLGDTTDKLYEAIKDLNGALKSVPTDAEEASRYYHNEIVPRMVTLRHFADLLEKATAKSYWPYPSYSDLLYY